MQQEELTLTRRLQALSQHASEAKIDCSELDECLRKHLSAGCRLPLDGKQWNKVLNGIVKVLMEAQGQTLVELLCLVDSDQLLTQVLHHILQSDSQSKLYVLSIVLQYTDRFNVIIIEHVSALQAAASAAMDSETYFRIVDAVPVMASLIKPPSKQSKLLTKWSERGDAFRVQLACQLEQQVRVVDRVDCARRRARLDKEMGIVQLDLICAEYHQRARGSNSKNLVETPYLATKLDSACSKLQANVFQHFVIRGPESCGKLAFAQLLKDRVTVDGGEGNFIVVTLEETFDSKNLVGTYVCDETGNFIFKKGPLTVAAEQGLWLVLRGIERAPPDLLTFLLPLVQENRLKVTANFELRPKLGFRIIALCQRSSSAASERFGLSEESLKGVEPLLSQLASVELDPLRATGEGHMRADFAEILERLYPRVHSFGWLTPFLLDSVTFIENRMNRMKGQLLDSAPYSVKHVLRLFKRVESQLKGVTGDTQFLNSYFVEGLVMHVQEVYMAHMYSADLMKRLLQQFIVEMVNPTLGENGVAQVDASAIIDQLFQHGREYAVSKQQYYFGRAQPVQRISHEEEDDEDMQDVQQGASAYVYTAATLRLLEQISVSLQMDEPVLLVGETGTGKTSCVQEIAKLQGKKLHVFNMNQNTDSSDLLGGFKPVDIKFLLRPAYGLFLEVFRTLFKSDKNEKFLQLMQKSYEANQFREFIQCMSHGLQSIKGKKLKEDQNYLKDKIDELDRMSQDLQKRARKLESGGGFIFQFIEGTLIESIKNGDWVLLDEINLANDTVLNKLATIVSGEHIMLNERADIVETKRHADFRLFMCMNPPYTSAGKKQLPAALRAKLGELYVPELTQDTDLWPIIDRNAPLSLFSEKQRHRILEFYQWVRAEVLKQTRKANIGLRNLSRAMKMMRSAISLKYPVHQAIHDSLMTCFTSHLDVNMQKLISDTVIKMFDITKMSGLEETAVTAAAQGYVRVGDFVIRRGETPPKDFQESDFILTKSFKRLVNRLASVVAVSDYAVILEGPTSAGKTSTVQYLANVTHNKIIRINNHMHTDIQEYIGSYVPSPETGKLVFQEGVLVEAVRNGHWVILDELNLAPSEVLEALNRLLDDNRELHIVETQKTIKAHHNFRLFATQNPTEGYGGRKELSEAFKNRFVLIKVQDVPTDELCEILVEKSKLPKSRAALMIKTMENLQIYRSRGSLFAGKDSIITVRDLLKWADRVRQADADKNGGGMSPQQIALEGFLVLGERSRSSQDKEFIRQTIAKTLKTSIEPEAYYEEYYRGNGLDKLLVSMVPTKQLKRLAVLLHKCLRNREPVLLVGETGVGKTSLCQVFAALNKQELFAINCHQNTETSDFIGCMRTRKGIEEVQSRIRQIITESGMEQTGSMKKDATALLKQFKEAANNESYKELKKLISEWKQIFEWHDGILVESMTQGGLLLIDEISLANDSVLERLNSVFERERVLTLSEKSSAQAISIRAHEKFNIVATMNPSGDFGKKELSPALRNRMTEIWVESYFSQAELLHVLQGGQPFITEARMLQNVDLYTIISTLSAKELTSLAASEVERLSLSMFNLITSSMPANQRSSFSIRDICTMIEFLKVQLASSKSSLTTALKHAAHLVLLDSIKINSLSSTRPAAVAHFNTLLHRCIQELFEEMEQPFDLTYTESSEQVTVGEFCIDKLQIAIDDQQFAFDAHTTVQNLHRVLRAFSLQRPILMEGPPGVGKTSLVENLAKRTGRMLTRVNLSEQTDMMDLLGSEYPVQAKGAQDDNDVQFKWCDGVLLRAIKEGHWFLIDEMNLAQQSVLEGLNAVLDHRRTVYIPELGREFTCHPNFFVFACQNPSQQSSGSVGGRKSLPKSFLNRFNKIYLEDLQESDYRLILTRKLSAMPELDVDMLLELARKNFTRHAVHQGGDTSGEGQLNIRDLNRFLTVYKQLRQNDSHERALKAAMHLSFVSQAKEPATVAAELGVTSKVTTQVRISAPDTLEFNSSDLYSLSLHGRPGAQGMPLSSLLSLQGAHSTTLQHMSLCLQAMLPILLVSNDAQRAVRDLQTLATFHGAEVARVLLNSRSDTAQLLGCFEQTADGESAKSRFEWVDSLLVQSMLNGRWVLFENANLASAAVLDRLNGLLEDARGHLVINEQGVIFDDEHPDGQLRIVQAAEGFRSIFLVEEASLLQAGVDVSRALRNRCQVIRLAYEDHQQFELSNIVDEQLTDARSLIDTYYGQLRYDLQAFRVDYQQVDNGDVSALEVGKKRSHSHESVIMFEQVEMQAHQMVHFMELLRRCSSPAHLKVLLAHTLGLHRDELNEIIDSGVDTSRSAMDHALTRLTSKIWTSLTTSAAEQEHLMSTDLRQMFSALKNLMHQGDIDKSTMFLLLKQLGGRHELSAYCNYLFKALTTPDQIESLPVTARVFSQDDLAAWNKIVDQRDRIKEQPFEQLVCLNLATQSRVDFTDAFETILLDGDKEIVEKPDEAVIHDHVTANSPYLIVNVAHTDKVSLCISQCELYGSLCHLVDLARLQGRVRSVPYPSQVPPIIDLGKGADIPTGLSLVAHDSTAEHPVLRLTSAILSCQQRSSLKTLPAYYYAANQLLSQLKSLDSAGEPLETLPIEQAEREVDEAVARLMPVIETLEQLPCEIARMRAKQELITDVELKGLTQYWSYNLRRAEDVHLQQGIIEVRDRLQSLEDRLLRCEQLMPLDGNGQALVALAASIKSLVDCLTLIQSFSQYQYATTTYKKLWPALEQLRSVLQHICVQSSLFVHFAHIISPLMKAAFQLMLALRKHIKTEQEPQLSALHLSIAPNFSLDQQKVAALKTTEQQLAYETFLLFMLRATDVDAAVRVHILDYFVQRDVARKMQEEMHDSDEEQVMKVPFKINMQQAILDETKAMDEMTEADKKRIQEEQEKEIEVVFPSYFGELQRAMVLLESAEADVERSEQIEYWRPAPVHTDDIMAELVNLSDRGESVYRTEMLRLRMQNVAIDLANTRQQQLTKQLKVDRLALESFHESDKRCWLQDAVNCLQDQLNQAQVKAVMNISEVELPKAYNFYHDPNPAEARLFYSPMHNLQERVREILKEYQSPILNDLLFLTNYMLTQFSAQCTPLMKLLTGMELLLGKLDEWDAYASKRLNSCEEQTNGIKQLIIRYRKLQILSWRNLLTHKRRQMIKKDFVNSVRLIHSIERQVFDSQLYKTKAAANSSKSVPMHVEIQIFQVIDMFIRDSALGQFEARLEALQLLLDGIRLKSEKLSSSDTDVDDGLIKVQDYDKKIKAKVQQRASRVCNIIAFVISYYSQFKPKLVKTIARLDEQAREKIKTLIDVSKWTLQKFTQVKSNIDKTHRQLNKACKVEEEILMQNISSLVLNSSRKKYVGAGSQGGDKLVSLDGEKKDILWMMESDPVYMPLAANYPVLKQLEFFSRTNIRGKWPDHLSLDPVISGFFERLKTVRDLDKKHIQRRALIDLLKFMREQGLSISFQDKLQKYMIEAPLLVQDNGDIQSKLEKYYNKAHELLVIMESSSQTDENADIKNPDIIRMQALSQSLMYHILQLNTQLVALKSASQDLKSARDSCPLPADKTYEQPQSLEHLAELRSSRSRLISLMKAMNERLAVLNKLDNAPPQVLGCHPDSHEAQELQLSITKTSEQLVVQGDRQTQLADIAKQELHVLMQQVSTAPAERPPCTDDVSCENVTKVTRIIYQELRKVFLKLDEENRNAEDGGSTNGHTEDAEGSLTELTIVEWAKFAKQVVGAVEMTPVLRREAVRLFEVKGELTVEQLSEVQQACHLLEHTQKQLDWMLEAFAQYQATLCKLSYLTQRIFLYLIFQGFCGKDDQEDGEDQQQEQLFEGEGCGMGDGNGDADKNVSNEIEHEEQLEGLKNYESEEEQQPEEKQQKQEGQDEQEENDFEMQEDFDGDMDSEPQEQKSDEDKDEEDEPDDEMDQVDDMLDNELWDKNMDDMEQKEDENNENDNEEKRELDLGERELDEQNQVDDKDKEMTAGDHEKQKEEQKKSEDRKDNAPEEDGEEQAPDDDSEHGQSQDNSDVDEEEKDPDEVPLNRPELVEEEQQEGSEKEDEKQSVEDVDMDQLDSVEDQEEDKDGEDDKQDGDDQDRDVEEEDEQNDDMSRGQQEGADDVSSVVSSLGLSQIGGQDEEDKANEDQTQQQEMKRKNAASENVNQASQNKNQATNPEQMDEQQEFDVNGNDVLFQMAEQIAQQQQKQDQQRNMDDAKQVDKDEEMKQVEKPRMDVTDQKDQPKQDNKDDQQAAEDQAYELDEDEAEQMQGNLAADKVEKTFEQKDDAPQEEEDADMKQMAEDAAPPQIEKTEKVIEDANMKDAKQQQQSKADEQKELEDGQPEEKDPEQQEAELHQRYTDYLQNKQQVDDMYEKDDENEDMRPEYEPIKNSIGNDFDYTEARRVMQMQLERWRQGPEEEQATALDMLSRFKQETSEAAGSLCEQLRIVLEPQLSQQLQGDFKSGKRLNMKKVISFIASHYRNDKIWLRRTMPSKRDYRILLAIDDSLSMSEQMCGFFSLEAMVTLVEALNRLEVGKVAVAAIRDRLELLQSFECAHSAERTAFNLSQFDFSHCAKDSHDHAMANFVRDCNKMLDVQNTTSQLAGATSAPFVIVLSDGRFNKANVQKYMQEAVEKRYLYIFVILDAPKPPKADGKQADQGGILSLRSATKGADGKGIKLEPYLKDFPFAYYCIVRDLRQLPEALGTILVQWFSMVSK